MKIWTLTVLSSSEYCELVRLPQPRKNEISLVALWFWWDFCGGGSNSRCSSNILVGWLGARAGLKRGEAWAKEMSGSDNLLGGPRKKTVDSPSSSLLGSKAMYKYQGWLVQRRSWGANAREFWLNSKGHYRKHPGLTHWRPITLQPHVNFCFWVILPFSRVVSSFFFFFFPLGVFTDKTVAGERFLECIGRVYWFLSLQAIFCFQIRLWNTSLRVYY